ncbi:hypothetical protein Godav_028403, partial [Gossypium davidsonii]|nr:hypothetical protein [Gossypium davidsonii]
MKDYWIMSKAIVFEVVGRALLYTAKACGGTFTLKI